MIYASPNGLFFIPDACCSVSEEPVNFAAICSIIELHDVCIFHDVTVTCVCIFHDVCMSHDVTVTCVFVLPKKL